LVVKWRLFSKPEDTEARKLYLWHIATRRGSGFVDANKKGVEVYLGAALELLSSMLERGFSPSFPIPVDPEGEILGGAHRTACALAIGIPVVIERRETPVWAPAWDASWFKRYGLPEEQVEALLNDYARLKGH
jgi:hypothetical protein